MASNTLNEQANKSAVPKTATDPSFGKAVRQVLRPLASLKLTVALFAMAIFIVLAGTMAQVDKDIWQVVSEYFRSPIAWIEFQIFFPPSFFPSAPQVPGGIYFPGGWCIGALMMINLLAAHGLRFKIQAKGMRLWSGLGAIAVAVLVIWLVIASGSNKNGLQGTPLVEWSTLWDVFKGGLFILSAASLGAPFLLKREQFLSEGERRLYSRVMLLVGLTLSGLTAWLFYEGDAIQLGDSSMRILWQLLKATFAGLVLLAGCIMVFRKRAGIVVLHAGVGLMMFSELLVGLTAVEAIMILEEGETSNFVRDTRTLELAVVDRSEPDHDDMVVIPKSILLGEETIQHEELPFDVEVVRYLANSSTRELKPDERTDNPADAGIGRDYTVDERRPGTGTDTGGEVDAPAAYVRFFDKKTSKLLGTYLVGVELSFQEIAAKVDADGKTYDVFLRFERTYKPYSITLNDVRKDDYMGTDTPRNYSSDVHLVDEGRDVDREIKIWMNNPLRYAGETYYQSNYQLDPNTGVESTTLQVVSNSGWMIPYVACMIVATGLLAQFSLALVRFLKRRSAAKLTSSPDHASDIGGKRKTSLWATVAPLAIVLIFAGWMSGKARLPSTSTEEMNLYEFGKIPILYQGRVKPIDTLARNSLRIISNRQTYVDEKVAKRPPLLWFLDERDVKQPAIRWLLDVIAKPRESAEHHVFRIDNPEVLAALGLERRPALRYGFLEFASDQEKFNEVRLQAFKAQQAGAEQLGVYEKKILELHRKVGVMDLVYQSFVQPPIAPIRAGEDLTKREDLLHAIGEQRQLDKREPPLSIPGESQDDDWQTYTSGWLRDQVLTGMMQKEPNPSVAALTEIFAAYANDDAKAFNEQVAKYHANLAKNTPEGVDIAKTNYEAFFNHFEPFFHATVLYLVAFVLAALAWLGWGVPLNRASFWLIAFTLVVHTFALVSRMYISGRPPVTNLYSSAVFIGWGCVVLGMILETVYRLGVGNVIAAVTGFFALGIAHFLSGDGDTFVVLQAVLDTQFWLATHVVAVTLGYSTTFLAGMLGVLYVLRGVLTPSLSKDIGRDLSRMIYGTLCFAIFFSFFGTVLGGLWADDSWGRFWGWDPKENGALIIVLWNALVLHARWDGMVKDRGLAILAIAGNIATSWSWFGVNELGVGLHSYGFTEGVLMALGLFVASQLLVIAVGMLPKRWWWSFRSGPPPADAAT